MAIEWPSEETQRFWAGVELRRDLIRLQREIVELYVIELAKMREERPWLSEARNDFHIFQEPFLGLDSISTDVKVKIESCEGENENNDETEEEGV